MAENFLTKKIADLPVWAWGLIGIAGIGVGYLIIKRTSAPAIPNQGAASDTSAGNVLPDQTQAGLQPSAPVGPGNPFPSVPTGNGTVPVVPPGYVPIYDSNGNLIGWQPPPAPPTVPPPGPGGSPPPPAGSPPPPPGTPGNPLIPKGQWPSNVPFVFGKTVTVNGLTYTIGPGSAGVIWGVPGTNYTLSQWNAVPIGTGPNQKVVIYQQ